MGSSVEASPTSPREGRGLVDRRRRSCNRGGRQEVGDQRDVDTEMGEEDSTQGEPACGKTADRVGTDRAGSAPQGNREAGDATRVRKESLHLVRERPAAILAAIAGWADSDEYDVVFMNLSPSTVRRWLFSQGLVAVAVPVVIGPRDGQGSRELKSHAPLAVLFPSAVMARYCCDWG